MKKTIITVLLIFISSPSARVYAAEPGWKFAVISDIHLSAQAGPGRNTGTFLKNLINRLVAERPDFVVIDGDFTRGTPNDNVPLEAVRAWWTNVHSVIKPLQDAGIPVIPVPGNHDFYTAAHQQAYKEAWKYFAPSLSTFTIQGTPPLNYSFTHKNAHFVSINAVNSYLPPEEADWLKKDLAQAGTSGLRFVFGHVPMDSALGKPVASFKKALGGILAGGRVAAYICGHEHLNWDHTQLIAGRPVRQIMVGPAMDEPYNYPIRRALYAEYCRACDGECMMPYTKAHFSTDPGTHLQKVRQTFYMVEVDPRIKGGYFAVPYTLDGAGRLAPFYSAGSGKLTPCPAGKKAGSTAPAR